MRKFYFLAILLLLFIKSNAAVTQKDSLTTEKKLQLAEIYVEKGNYPDAAKLYESLLREDPENPVYNFYLGYCYLFTTNDKSKATQYLKKASQSALDKSLLKEDRITTLSDKVRQTKVLREVPMEAHYWYAKALHLNYRFSDAIEVYNELLPKIPKKNIDFTEAVKHDIEMCQNGLEITKQRVQMAVFDLTTLNTEFDEHSPIVTADENTIVFTSRRPGGYSGEKKTSDGQYFEDIYISKKVDDQWTAPVNIGSDVNSNLHDASISLSVDGKQLFIYRSEHNTGDIYYSSTEDGVKWSTPQILNKNINSKARETHATISADGQYLYFTSDRDVKEGKFLHKKLVNQGGMDIWVSKKLPNGDWGTAKNLGPVINTIYDEEAPFISADGTLYFSSKGHTTIGGYDIFCTKQDEKGNWSTPKNIGYPINTTEDDVYYVVNPSGLRAYYSSRQFQQNSVGGSDIYTITLGEDNIANMVAMSGVVGKCDKKPLDDIKVTVKNAATDEIVGTYTPDAKTGKYTVILPPKKMYKISYEAQNYISAKDSFEVSKKNIYIETRKVVPLADVVLCTPPPVEPTFDITVNDLNFEYNKYEVNKKEKTIFDNLDQFAEYLKSKTGVKVEIHGYTCEIGTEEYNMGLSKRRANFIRSYLEKKGVAKEAFDVQWSGEKDPIAITRNPDGTMRKEGLPYNRRVQFKVLVPGSSKIKIIEINVPENLRIKKAK